MRNAEVLQRMPEEEAAPKKQELTLDDIFSGKKLTSKEKTAISVLNNNHFGDLSTAQKVDMFNYNLFQELGPSCRIRLKELYGEVREDVVERVVDKIIYNDRLVEKYDDFYKSYEAAIINSDKKARFITLQKRGHSMQNAAELADLDEKEAKRIRLQAIRAGKLEPLTPPGKKMAYRFRENRNRVKEIRNSNPGQLILEIAEKLGLTSSMVREAIHSLIIEGEIQPLTQEKLERLRFPKSRGLRKRIEQAIKNNPDISEKELAERFEITIYSLEHHKRRLQKEGRIAPNKVQARNKRIKNQLRQILDRHMSENPGKPINIYALGRSGNINAPTSRILRIYHELEKEEVVPPTVRGKKTTK